MVMQQDMPMKTPKKRRILGPCAVVLAAANTGNWRMVRPVVDMEKCVQCGICASYCPCGVIDTDRKAKTFDIDYNFCKGCGICANECPKQALTMVPEGGEK